MNNFIKVDGATFVRKGDYQVKKGLSFTEITVKVNNIYKKEFEQKYIYFLIGIILAILFAGIKIEKDIQYFNVNRRGYLGSHDIFTRYIVNGV